MTFVIVKDGKVVLDGKTSELKQDNSEYVSIKLFHNPDRILLAKILEDFDYTFVLDNELKIYNVTIDNLQIILSMLLENGIVIGEVTFDKDSLTKMYLNLMGDDK